MRNTKFSLQVDLETEELTLMCHFKLEGVMNHSTMHIFNFNSEHTIPRISVYDADDMDSFKSICKVFNTGRWVVKLFLDKAVQFAIDTNQDIRIEHESIKFLRFPDSIERLVGRDEPPSNVEILKRLSGLI